MELVYTRADFHMIREPHMIPVEQNAADIANAKLAEWLKDAVRVEGCLLKESGLTDQHGPGWVFAEPTVRYTDGDTHSALLIAIQPIKKDTAESLLREIIADHEALLRADPGRKEWVLVTRARKLLGEL